MRYISTFSGIGGFELGIERAYFFQVAKELAETSNNPHPVAALVVYRGEILGAGTNSHITPCKRQGYPTGVGYELCEGCQYTNHAEIEALVEAQEDALEADLYLYGHTYACTPCIEALDTAGITNIHIKDNDGIIRSFNVSAFRRRQEAAQGSNEEGEGLHSVPVETTLHQDGRTNEHTNTGATEGQSGSDVPSTPRDEQGRVYTTTERALLIQKQMGVQQPTCVGYSEIDKYAIKVYDNQFEGHKNYGDITKINAEDLPDFDCLVGGFPCQAFSIAGKRGGFDDTRGTLFFDLARILRAKQPRLFVFENVKGLLSHDNGNTFRTIIATITELGYDAQWQVLNSKNHGVPQNRERIIIVGHLRTTSRPEVFPLSGSRGKNLQEITKNVSDSQRVYTTDLAKSQKALGGGMGAKTGLYAVDFNRKDGVGNNIDVAHTLSASDYRGLNRNQTQTAVMDNMQIRRLTPVECERLQGFPDHWTQFGVGGEVISDTQRYKMTGNAVTTNVFTEVFSNLFEGIK